MAGLVPIQLSNATNGQTGPLASSAGAVTGFAAVLFSLFNPGTGPTTPHEPVRVSKPDFSDPGNGPESPTSAAMKSADLWPLDPEGEPEAPCSAAVKPIAAGPLNSEVGPEMPPLVAVEASGSGLSNSAPGTGTRPSAGEEPVASPNAPSANRAAQRLRGTVVPQPASAVPARLTTPVDGGRPDQGPFKPENVQTPPDDANSATAVVSHAALAVPLGNGNTRDEGPQDEAATPLLPTASSGKNEGGVGGTHIRGHRLSGEHPLPEVQAQVNQSVPADVAPTAVEPTLQQPTGPVSLPIQVTPPPPSDPVVTVTSQIRVAGGDKSADPQRPVPVDPTKAQPLSADHPVGGASPPALSQTAAEPGKTVLKTGDVPETQAVIMRAEVPQTSTLGTNSAPPSRVDQAQPAAPADQMAPALVGILQRTDGQQSVTVRLQPAELGQVQIRIDQTVAGTAHIDITAERPETLQLLQRDEPRLQQILDQVGVLSTGRTVSFQVSAQEQIGAAASRPDSMETGAGASGQGQNGGAWRQNGDSPNDFGRSPDPDQGQSRPRWFRAGLDITA